MSVSAGEIGLDLVLNRNGFDRQLQGINNTAKKAAASLAAAFSLKAIINFGNECIELGSDLAEVQNVVDVTFPNMAAQINDFAKNAANSFGLSETMAKRFTGTFGSMAEAFGFSEKEAANMAKTLTGLSGDVASFYNISQDEAYTKLKSVFSGETESLKDLGIVMTQTSLDQFALANGFGKTTEKMTEAEKVSLRLAFVQKNLANANGDFARTSDSWANQTRILSLQVDSLKAKIGQGLINVLKPVLALVNQLTAKMVTLADAFLRFTQLLSGKKSASDASGSFNAVSDSASDAAENVSDVGTAAEESARKAERSTAGFDKINKLSSKSSSASTKPGGNTAQSGGGTQAASSPVDTSALDFVSKKLDAIKKKINTVKNLFKKGFNLSIGNTAVNITSIIESLNRLKKTFKDIFTDKGLTQSASGWVQNLITYFGTVTGAFLNVGSSIVSTIVKGISNGFANKKDVITGRFTKMFDFSSEAVKIQTQLTATVSEILSDVFTSVPATGIATSLTGIFIEAFTGVGTLAAGLGRDITNLIAKPIIENKDKIKKALTNALRPIDIILQGIGTAVKNVVNKAIEVYEKKISPALDDIADGISEVTGALLDAYNKYISPTLKRIAKMWSNLYTQHLAPMINELIECIGNIVSIIGKLWKKYVAPFASVLIELLTPAFAALLEIIQGAITGVLALLIDTVKNILKVFNDLADGTLLKKIKNFFGKAWKAIVNTFKKLPAWFNKTFKKAWSFIKNIFSAKKTREHFGKILASIHSKFSDIGEWFKKKFSTAWSFIKNIFSAKKAREHFGKILSSIHGKFSDIGEWFKKKFSTAWSFIKNIFSAKKAREHFGKILSSIHGKFSSIGEWFSKKFGGAWSKITEKFSLSNIADFFGKVWSKIKEPFLSVADWFKNTFSDAWQKVKDVFSTGSKVFTGIKDGIADVFKDVVNKLISGINTIISFPFKKINGMLNSIRDKDIFGIKPFHDLWDKDPLSIPEIPKLASGGYVKANTPQLAMIGDNRHQGEVVAPENKLLEMAKTAASMSSAYGLTREVIELLKEILITLKEMDLDVKLDGKSIKENTVKLINQHTKTHGVCEIK